jgi:predicted hydrocarbon binding protein
VATLQEIGQDWGKRLEKGLAKDWMFFFGIFLARSSFHR